jgi:peroxiredoxin
MSRALRLDFPVLVDAGQRTGRQYEVDRLPLTFLLDREGQVRAVWREPVLGPGFGDIVREVSSE